MLTNIEKDNDPTRKIFQKSYWLLLSVTVPQFIFLLIMWRDYSVIHTLLSDESKRVWGLFAGSLGFLWLAYTFPGVRWMITKKPLSLFTAISILITHLAYLIFFIYFISDFFPSGIPQWMVTGSSVDFYPFAFLMPALLHSLLIIVEILTPPGLKSVMVGIGGLVLLVGFWYGSYLTSISLIRYFPDSVWIAIILISIILFAFFLLQIAYVIYIKKIRSGSGRVVSFIYRLLVTLIFPLTGLALNNGVLFKGFSDFVFGDFSHPFYYFVAVITATLLLIPDLDSYPRRLWLFLFRWAVLPYTLYFFLIFLPFLPLSFFAILFFGAGLLMFAPLLLMQIHVSQIITDFGYLKGRYGLIALWGMAVPALGILPAILTVNHLMDRNTLHEALNHVYENDYSASRTVDIDGDRLNRVLDTVDLERTSGRSFLNTAGRYTPYLSDYYRWLVLDNMTLSRERSHLLRRIYSPEKSGTIAPSNISVNSSPGIRMGQVRHNTTVLENGIRKTSIDLKIEYQSDQTWGQGEFVTTFEIPEGSFISDYRLKVGDRMEEGLLAEKRAALWIYRQIMRRRRDPGVLYYIGENRLMLRVFPFAPGEIRETGFTVIHPGDLDLSIGGNRIIVKAGNKENWIDDGEGRTIYASAEKIRSLPVLERHGYYHILVDASYHSRGRREELKKRAEGFLASDPLGLNHGPTDVHHKISIVNYNIDTMNVSDDWQKALGRRFGRGSFLLENALRHVFYRHLKEDDIKEVYPIPIVISEFFDRAVAENGLSDMKFANPAMDVYFLEDNGNPIPVSLSSHKPVRENPVQKSNSLLRKYSYPVALYVREGDSSASQSQPVLFRRDGRGHIAYNTRDILNKDVSFTENMDENRSVYQKALKVDGAKRHLVVNPDREDAELFELYRGSLKAHVLTSNTTFIVVENEAQKTILRQKEKQALAGKGYFDFSNEGGQTMSEPDLKVLMVFFLILAALFYFLRRRYYPGEKYDTGVPGT